MTDMLRLEDFTPHVGRQFRFQGWAGALRLAEAEPARVPGAPAGGRAPFILIFHGPRENVLAQGTYQITAEDGTRFAFHITPIHTVAPDRQEYQAIFT